MVTFLVCMAAAALFFFFKWQNSMLVVNSFDFEGEKVPPGFDGYKIVQISDLHNASFGEDQSRLIDKIAALKPEIILVTGDLIDSRRTRREDVEPALTFIQKAVALAPVYYSPGNHESRIDYLDELIAEIKKRGAVPLMDESIPLFRGGSRIALIGAQDYSFWHIKGKKALSKAIFAGNLEVLTEEAGGDFQILLSHRPEYFGLYQEAGVDLVFSGHAHGGQWRLPLLGGLYGGPEQGFFPKYTTGLYRLKGCAMAVSRGLGNSIFPARLFNFPEVVCVTLRRKR